jgi:hypothetical protein
MFKVVNGKSERDELISFLEMANRKGIIGQVDDRELRDVMFLVPNKRFISTIVSVEWYTNLVTVRSGGLRVDCDEILFQSTHPNYLGEYIALYHRGECVARIGRESF